VPVSVLLVDDVNEVRLIVRQALRLRGGFDVVAEAGDGRAAIAAAGEHHPDVVVLDLGLPDLAGREVITGLREVAPDAQVVVFTGNEADVATVGENVAGFVRKDDQITYLIDLLEDLGRRAERSAVFQMGPNASEVSDARQFVAERCDDWSCGEMVDDALIVVSELVTNAVVHAHSGCELRARMATDKVLRLEVVDAGRGTPDPRSAADDDEHGRGLVLVSALSAAWGVDSLPDGRKLVWAELLVPATTNNHHY